MAAIVFALTFGLWMGSAHVAREGVDVLVSAAASLTDVLRQIAQAYERGTGQTVVLNFGPSSGLARQIVEGAPVDLFISADAAQMAVVAAAGMVEAPTRVDLLSNQLAIVVPDDRLHTVRTPRDLLEPRIRRIAVANPAGVPAGVYAKQYLVSIGLWQPIASKIVPTATVRAALAAVESGNVDAAVVYRTDAAIATRARVAFLVPPAQGPAIVYPGAVVTGGRNQPGARRFLAYLRGPEARAAFERAGFIVLQGTRAK